MFPRKVFFVEAKRSPEFRDSAALYKIIAAWLDCREGQTHP